MRHEALALLLTALVVSAAGCATKDFVRETVGDSQAKLEGQLHEQGQAIGSQAKRLDAEAGRVDTHAKQIAEIGGRFGKLETSVDEFGNIARTSAAKSEEAVARAEEVNKRVSRLLANASKRREIETIQVHFGFNHADLTDATQTALAALIKELAGNPALTVDLEGYTDSTGPLEYNLQLSERRVGAVRRFLAGHGVELSRINWIGMGELADKGSPAERARNRRVTLRLMLPEDQLAAQPTSSKPSEEAMSPKGDRGKVQAPETAASPPASRDATPSRPKADEPKATEPETAAPASTEEAAGKPTEQTDSKQ